MTTVHPRLRKSSAGLELEVLEDRRVLSSSPLLPALSVLPALPFPTVAVAAKVEVADIRVELSAATGAVEAGPQLALKAGIGVANDAQVVAQVGVNSDPVVQAGVSLGTPPAEGGSGGGGGVGVGVTIDPGNTGGGTGGGGTGGILPGGLPGGTPAPQLPPLPGDAGSGLSSAAPLLGQSGGGIAFPAFAGFLVPSGALAPTDLTAPAAATGEIAPATATAIPSPASQTAQGTGANSERLVDEAFVVGVFDAVPAFSGRAISLSGGGQTDAEALAGAEGEVKGTDLLTDFAPAGGAAVDGLLQQLLARLNELGKETGGVFLSRETIFWVLAGALAAAGYVHFHRRRPGADPARRAAPSSSWKWLSGSASFTPQPGA